MTANLPESVPTPQQGPYVGEPLMVTSPIRGIRFFVTQAERWISKEEAISRTSYFPRKRVLLASPFRYHDWREGVNLGENQDLSTGPFWSDTSFWPNTRSKSRRNFQEAHWGFYACTSAPSLVDLHKGNGVFPVLNRMGNLAIGVIEATGNVALGPKGFRAEQATLLALGVQDEGCVEDLHDAFPSVWTQFLGQRSWPLDFIHNVASNMCSTYGITPNQVA